MFQKEIEFDGKQILCTAEMIEWIHGLKVSVKLSMNNERVAALEVVCARNDKHFSELSRLSENELTQKALERFLDKKLSVDCTRLFEWQQELQSLGYTGISPLFTSF